MVGNQPLRGGQRELALRPATAEQLREHLLKCRLAAVAAGLAALVRARGDERRLAAGERVWVLTISTREAAPLLGCSDRAVAKAAATLSRGEWFSELKGARGKPSTYVLDFAAAAATETPEQQLDGWLTGAHPCEPVRTSAHRCEPVRTAPRVHTGLNTKPVSSFHPCSSTGPAAGSQAFAPVRTPPGGEPFRPEPTIVAPPRAQNMGGNSPPTPAGAPGLPRYPWARDGGVTDRELVDACRGGDVRLLRHLYDHAARLGWLAASDDAWLKFLTGCHHAATANLARRMGRLVTFVKSGLDVSRMRQRSEQWAAELIKSEHRDPLLVSLGRSMTTCEE